MKKSLFICFSLLMFGCYENERNCADFKTGTFEFESTINGKLVKTRFTRNDSIEVDYFNNKIDSSSIRWINDCEYIVKKLNPKNMAEEKAVHIKILSTRDNSYTFEYSLVGQAIKQKGTTLKIN